MNTDDVSVLASCIKLLADNDIQLNKCLKRIERSQRLCGIGLCACIGYICLKKAKLIK